MQMKFSLAFSLLFVIFVASLSAVCQTSYRGNPGVYPLDEVEVGAGYMYRHDSLKYKLSNDLADLKSERQFNNINTNQFTAYGKCWSRNFYFRGYGGYGWVDRGSTKEETSIDSILTFAQRGCVSQVCTFDVSLAVGYVFDFCTTNFRVAPLFGYSWHVQYFRSHDHRVIIDLDNFLAPNCKLERWKEDYKANWFGPWVGFDAEYDCYCNWSILAGFEYHWPSYQAKFRRDAVTIFDTIDFPFIEREDYACAEGFVGNVGLRNDFCPNWTFLVLCSFQTWNLHHGLGKDNFRFLTEVDYVKWNSFQATVAMAFVF